jgi:hypothetical protein
MPMSLPERIPIVAEHAQAIGYVCILWATMEINLDRLLETVLQIDNEDVADSLTANMDTREKLHALKAAAFLRKPDQKWFDHVEELVTYVDDTLRVARNRFVHDIWILTSPDTVEKRTRKTVLRKPKSFAPPELIRFTQEAVDVKEIWQLADSIQEIARQAMLSRSDYERLWKQRHASPPKSP